MTLHHTLLLADLCEKLEAWFHDTLPEDKKYELCKAETMRSNYGNLTAEEKYDLRDTETFLANTAKCIVDHDKRYGVSEVLDRLQGTACRRSLVRDAIRLLVRENAAALLEAVA